MRDNQDTSRVDSGFGIVEVIVAMVLMALILMAIAPFLVSAFQTSARHIRMAGASAEVDSRIDTVVAADRCGSLADRIDPLVEVLPGTSRNIEYRVAQVLTTTSGVDFDVSQCQTIAGNPSGTGIATYFYQVHVYDEATFNPSGDNTPLATGRTWVSVKE